MRTGIQPGFAICFALLLLTIGLQGCSSAPPADIPGREFNVVLVTLDTTRVDRFGCYGYARNTTRNFDALAGMGFKFDMAIAQAAVTPVSHASILTGLNPYGHGVRVLLAKSGYYLSSEIPTLATVLHEQRYRTGAFLSAFPVSEYYGFDAGFEQFDNGMTAAPGKAIRKTTRGWSWNQAVNQRSSKETTDSAIRWLGEIDSPFFIWVHYWDPHDPARKPPPEIVAQFATPDQDDDDQRRNLYDAEVFYVDQQFGRLVQALIDLGRFDDTMVVIVADHGEGLGDHGWWHHRILYQEQIRVPLIVRLPDVEGGRTVPEVVRSIDIFPTVLDTLGITPPSPVEGLSLVPLMQGRPEAPRVAYADQLNLYDLNARMLKKRPHDDLLHCAIDHPWKLIYRPLRPEQSQLYRLDQDPGESQNLYEPDHPEALRLLDMLEQFDGFVDQSFGDAEDEEMLERLRSLGYVGSSRSPGNKTKKGAS